MSAIEKLVDFWNSFYNRQLDGEQIVEELLSPLKEIPNNRYGTVYHSVMDAIGDQSIYYPEPYFGFIDQMDANRDVLALFMNPGSVDHSQALEWNEGVIRQYTEWKPEHFLRECGVNDALNTVTGSFPECTCYLKDRHQRGCNIWRRKRFLELRRDFNITDLRFLHTMEMFPFHSKVWDGRIKNHLTKMSNLEFMKLTLNAVQEIATQRRVKCILAVGKVWEDMFDQRMNWYSNTKKQFSGSIGVRVAHYQATPDSSPVIVMVRQVQGGVKFTENQEAQKYIRSILGTGDAIYIADEERSIIENKQKEQNSLLKSENNSQEDLIIEAIVSKVIPQINHTQLIKGKVYSPTKTKFNYIHLWFDQYPWHENHFSFHIHVYKDFATNPKIEVRFGMNYKQLNFPEEIKLALFQKLKNIAEINGLKTKERDNVSFNIVQLCEGTSANEDAVEILKVLINQVRESVDQIKFSLVR